MPDEIIDGTVIETLPPTETLQSEIETATAVSGLAVEAAIASADEAQQRDEDLRTWLDGQFNTQLQTMTELQNSQLSTRETMTTILERLSQMTTNQQSQSETLTTLGNSTLAAVQQLQLSLPEMEEVLVEEPETLPETEPPSESAEEDNPEPSTSHATRRNTIRKV